MIYRMHYMTSDGSIGHSFYGSRREVEKQRAAVVRQYRDDNDELPEIIIDCAPTPKTKGEVLRLLSRWASHPDNG